MLDQVSARLGAADFLAGAEARAAEKTREAAAASTPLDASEGGSG